MPIDAGGHGHSIAISIRRYNLRRSFIQQDVSRPIVASTVCIYILDARIRCDVSATPFYVYPLIVTAMDFTSVPR